jgi:hypothetical protein
LVKACGTSSREEKWSTPSLPSKLQGDAQNFVGQVKYELQSENTQNSLEKCPNSLKEHACATQRLRPHFSKVRRGGKVVRYRQKGKVSPNSKFHERKSIQEEPRFR